MMFAVSLNLAEEEAELPKRKSVVVLTGQRLPFEIVQYWSEVRQELVVQSVPEVGRVRLVVLVAVREMA
jgi:hypothetical protein